MKRPMQSRTTKQITADIRVVMVSFVMLSVSSMSGCSVWENRPRLREQKIKMDVSTQGVPPIKVETFENKYLLVMFAPNSGWSIDIDKDERIETGMRLFVTVRRPDPAFMYPQAMVWKRRLSNVHADTNLEIYARVLDADEKAKGHGYGLLTPVDRFEE